MKSVNNKSYKIYPIETTRITPFPFPIWKNCTESIDLTDFDGKTVHIEKGVRIILPINALHSHPDFYANPEKFDPERFEESNGGVKRLKDAGVFMPFGNGPRQCLGGSSVLTYLKPYYFYIVEIITCNHKLFSRNACCRNSNKSRSLYSCWKI